MQSTIDRNTTDSFKYDDGGRSQAGFKGTTKDCVTRAIAIATGLPYRDVYDRLNQLARSDNKKSSARTGVHRNHYDTLLKELGWTWVPTMRIGQGCKIHLNKSELPTGTLIVKVSKHVVAVRDGVIYDTYDCSRNGTRCVYGYYWEGGRHEQDQ